MAKLWAFVRLTRPVFLLGGALVYALGALVARPVEEIDWGAYALGQTMVTLVQLTTQYLNEHHDRAVDELVGEARTWFSGGSGVLAAGALRPEAAQRAAAVAGLAAVGAVIAVATESPAAAVVGAAALGLGWAYSAPPLRLVASGWGEAVASVVVALLTPLAGALLQGGGMSWRLLAVAGPLVAVHLAMLLAFDRPDAAADAAGGKATLFVRLGRRRAGLLHAALLAVAYAAMAGVLAAGTPKPDEGGLVFLTAPLAVRQVRAMLAPSSSPDRLTLAAVVLFAAWPVLLLAGLAT